MGIGVSIFLLAVGAVLAFAVEATVAGLDITVVGWILMAAGAFGLITSLIMLNRRGRVVGSGTVDSVTTTTPVRSERVVERRDVL